MGEQTKRKSPAWRRALGRAFALSSAVMASVVLGLGVVAVAVLGPSVWGPGVAGTAAQQGEAHAQEAAEEAEPRELTPAEREAAEAAFHTMMDALTSPRCVNCHPSDGVPKQTDAARPHLFGVAGGEDLHGYDALRCTSCHQASNNGWSGVPGAPGWSLAPASMQWEGLDRYAIARSMMDPAKNGGRSAEDILHHLTEHELVLWAWEPGVDGEGQPRTPPPVPLDDYKAAVQTWIAAGAPIPESASAEGTAAEGTAAEGTAAEGTAPADASGETP